MTTDNRQTCWHIHLPADPELTATTTCSALSAGYVTIVSRSIMTILLCRKIILPENVILRAKSHKITVQKFTQHTVDLSSFSTVFATFSTSETKTSFGKPSLGSEYITNGIHVTTWYQVARFKGLWNNVGGGVKSTPIHVLLTTWWLLGTG
jgi:hypothetical protein